MKYLLIVLVLTIGCASTQVRDTPKEQQEIVEPSTVWGILDVASSIFSWIIF